MQAESRTGSSQVLAHIGCRYLDLFASADAVDASSHAFYFPLPVDVN